MKDINKEEYQEFERSWAEAFDNAEQSPSENLWSSIDAQLANKDNERFKRKILFYKLVAAASIGLAMIFGYFSYNILSNNFTPLAENKVPKDQNADRGQLTLAENGTLENDQATKLSDKPGIAENDNPSVERAKNNIPQDQDERTQLHLSENGNLGSEPATDLSDKPLVAANNSPLVESDESNLGTTNENAISREFQQRSSASIKSKDDSQQTLGTSLIAGAKDAVSNSSIVVARDSEKMDQSAYALQEQLIANESSEGAPLLASEDKESLVKKVAAFSPDLDYVQLFEAPEIYAIPGYRSLDDIEAQEDKKPVFWAGLDLGSSLFDPNFEDGSNFNPKASPALSSDLFREAPQVLASNEETDPGVSYSLGFNFGVRVSEKWVIQSGIQYASRSASTNRQTSVRSSRNKNMLPSSNMLTFDLGSPSENAKQQTISQEYEMVNNFKFASFPLKAGYLLIDKKVGLMLTAGVAADFFLSNTLSENDNKLDEVTVDAGSESPFRDVNFSGLFGAEIFYEISNRYHLTLEPNYTIALSPITKSGEQFTSTPQLFGISAGLKYFIK